MNKIQKAVTRPTRKRYKKEMKTTLNVYMPPILKKVLSFCFSVCARVRTFKSRGKKKESTNGKMLKDKGEKESV